MTTTRGFLDSVSAGNFRIEDGRTLYFPYGALGQGYVVPSPQIENAIRARLRHYHAGLLGFIALFTAAMSIVDVVTAIVILMVGLAIVFHVGRRLTTDAVKGLSVSDAQWQMSMALAKQAAATPRWQAWLQVAVFTVLSLGGVWLVVAASTSGETMLTLGALGTLAISLPLLAFSIYILLGSLREAA